MTAASQEAPPPGGWSDELVQAYLETFGYHVERVSTDWILWIQSKVEWRIFRSWWGSWRGVIYHQQNGTIGMVNCKDLEDVMSWLQNRWSELQETT